MAILEGGGVGFVLEVVSESFIVYHLELPDEIRLEKNHLPFNMFYSDVAKCGAKEKKELGGGKLHKSENVQSAVHKMIDLREVKRCINGSDNFGKAICLVLKGSVLEAKVIIADGRADPDLDEMGQLIEL